MCIKVTYVSKQNSKKELYELSRKIYVIKQLIVFWKVGAKFKLVAQAQRNGFQSGGAMER